MFTTKDDNNDNGDNSNCEQTHENMRKHENT